MKFLSLAITTLMAGTAMAAPAPVPPPDSIEVTIELYGPNDGYYQTLVPVDNKKHKILYEKSVSSVSSNAPEGVTCTIYSIEGDKTVLQGTEVSINIFLSSLTI
jgi:hypothetical protein